MSERLPEPQPQPVPREVRIEPDAGIPDLIRRLTDDSKRLANDEFRLAKMEVKDSLHTATRGALWLALAFGTGVVALVTLTILLVAAFGQLFDDYWAGALVTGALWLVLGFFLLKRGLDWYQKPSYTLPATRHELQETAQWAKHPERAD